MQTRPLGKTGLQLPILSFGASSLGAEFRSVKLDEVPVTDAKPVVQSKTFWTGAGVAASGIVTAGQQIQGLAAPQAANSDLIAKLAAAAAVLIVAGGIAVMVFRYLDAKRARS